MSDFCTAFRIPFEVELLYGLRFIVDCPDVVSWNGGAAGFIDGDGEIYFFDYQDTKEMGRNPYASPV